MKKESEKQVEAYLVDRVKMQGGIAYKFISPGHAGVPDRLVVMPGMAPVFVELKTLYGGLSPLQKKEVQRLEMLGQSVEVAHSCEEVDEILWKVFQL